MISWQGQMGVREEVSYGVGLAPDVFLEVESGNVDTAAIRVDGEAARGTRWQYRSVLVGLDYTFTFELWAFPNFIGEMLKWSLGNVVTTTLVGSEKQHTITPLSSLNSFTFSIDRNIGTNPTFRGDGAKINSLTLENNARDILRLTSEGFLQKHSFVAALSPVDANYSTVRALQFKDLAVSKGYAGVAPSSDQTIERFAVTITNNLISDKVTADGTDYISALPEGILEVVGAFDREFEDLTDYNNFVADNQLDLLATWTGPSMGTNPYRLQLDIPNARITSLPLPQIAGTSERGLYTVEFRALYFTTDSRVMAAILDNTVASY